MSKPNSQIKSEAMTSSWAVNCVKSECISRVLVTLVLHIQDGCGAAVLGVKGITVQMIYFFILFITSEFYDFT
jgi:hypothetical protein